MILDRFTCVLGYVNPMEVAPIAIIVVLLIGIAIMGSVVLANNNKINETENISLDEHLRGLDDESYIPDQEEVIGEN